MTDLFPIVDVSGWTPLRDEQMGSKEKRWLEAPDSKKRWLFKKPRRGNGEDWAEKAAEQLANLLGVPHARVELAQSGETLGAICLDFGHRSTGQQLVHGNELLAKFDPDYQSHVEKFTTTYHTVDRVRDFLLGERVTPPDGTVLPDGVVSGFDVFLGYLLLDAWIGNTDRHHENWAVFQQTDVSNPPLELAPSYDHGSSLGRNEPDAQRERRLNGPDPNFSVEAYAGRTPSRFFRSEGDRRPLHPIDVFAEAATGSPGAAGAWLGCLRGVPEEAVMAVFDRIPPDRASGPARRFALELLKCNRRRLLELVL